MAKFTGQEVSRVLADLRRRFPTATEADALTILEDGERAYRDEREFELREIGAIERAAIYGTDALDELAAEQDECARFHA